MPMTVIKTAYSLQFRIWLNGSWLLKYEINPQPFSFFWHAAWNPVAPKRGEFIDIYMRKVWCGWRDLNPHALRRQNLNLVRLPISPHPHLKLKHHFFFPYQKDIQVSRAKTNFLKKIFTNIRKHNFFIKRLFFNQVV